ncbi:MAG: 3'(2'),5'-bisphosphate nucleotidase [Candidatus Ozemobacter sibiricus]|uniref:3'(2'),5-bisphosphonucleoside 3'(2')-phosphohydrolase n=1 Tax=Candidatus Ozemobacter sibiricus TaxID=2268124 RepID=A0A367ZT64_9BACT|nr:MAG: 3'(2'),5'-bisphosphate nucleotidase [Candidatus Ozemobacter sibiricus]
MIPLPFPHPDLEVAVGAVLAASQAILAIYEQGFDVAFKPGQEPVTQADRLADRLLVEALHAAFPGDAILSEEQGLQHRQAQPEQRVWFIDPIDGTKEFIKRNGEFAIQVGAARAGRLELGIICQPTAQRWWVGVHGHGCHTRQGDQAWQHVRLPARQGPPILALSRSHPSARALQLAARLGSKQQLARGSVGLKLMAIAAGEAHFYLNDSNSTKAWDLAAPELLFTEAGGMVTDQRGRPFVYDPARPHHEAGLLATADGDLHRQILDLLASLPHTPADRSA